MKIHHWLVALILVGMFVASGLLLIGNRPDHKVGELPDHLREPISIASLPNEQAYRLRKELIEKRIAWAAENDEPQLEALALAQFAENENRFGGPKEVILEKLARANEILGDDRSAAKAKVLLVSGMFKVGQVGKSAEAISEFSSCVHLARLHRDDQTLALGLVFLARALSLVDRIQESIVATYEAIEVAETLGKEELLKQVYFESCRRFSSAKMYKQGAPIAERCLELIPNCDVALELLFWHQRDLSSLNKYAQAIERNIDRLKNKRNKTKHEWQKLALSHMRLASIEGSCNRYDTAIGFVNEALRYARQSNSSGLVRAFELQRVDYLLANGEHEDAKKLFVKITHLDEDFRLLGPATGQKVLDLCQRLELPTIAMRWTRFSSQRKQQQMTKNVALKCDLAAKTWGIEQEVRGSEKASSEKIQTAQHRTLLGTTGMILAVSIGLVLMIRVRVLRKIREHLEALVETRTTELREALESSELAHESKREFLARANHEIRNPLHAITSYTELLQYVDPKEDRQWASFVDAIDSASNHLLQLVGDVIDVAKIEAGTTSPKLRNFSISDLAHDTNSMLSELARRASVDLSFDLGGCEIDEVFGDDSATRQILINLVRNAIQASENGIVEVNLASCFDSSRKVRFAARVSDTGRGIAAEFHYQVFEPFAQFHENDQGNGLGLYITKSLVSLLGGEIRFTSEPGLGQLLIST